MVTDGREQPLEQLVLKSIIATMVTSTFGEQVPVVQSGVTPKTTWLVEE
ncbi:hypothetical protein PS862_03966 [Pseudomonas fluorescens]|uniref:Uncharacterized protein n=1 Tax=Pseudomonas fluorescens TaxID=294 RepID=A0A5E7MF67_PSEFL|nr:hypothetical protein PS639_01193 [Pseudomonas fluorescens]VVP23223.1 hypothetical protein PS862_03966 [Pseudomonas fluorescens]